MVRTFFEISFEGISCHFFIFSIEHITGRESMVEKFCNFSFSGLVGRLLQGWHARIANGSENFLVDVLIIILTCSIQNQKGFYRFFSQQFLEEFSDNYISSSCVWDSPRVGQISRHWGSCFTGFFQACLTHSHETWNKYYFTYIELLVLIEWADFHLSFDTKITSLSIIYLEIHTTFCDPNRSWIKCTLGPTCASIARWI